MTKQVKIYDNIVFAHNNLAEAVRYADKAIALLNELYFESIADGNDEDAQAANRIKLRLESYFSEKTRFLPAEIDSVRRDMGVNFLCF